MPTLPELEMVVVVAANTVVVKTPEVAVTVVETVVVDVMVVRGMGGYV